MIEYIKEWLHIYSIHLGVVVAVLLLFDIYKNGLPDSLKLIQNKILVAIVLGSLIGLFTSHANTHYLFHILKEIK